ncbi:MAG: transposase, partial [Alteromonas sp.]|nr:transposase [Alteromonas sp.]
VRKAASAGYIDLSNILLDSSLIAASSDLARFFPDSPTTFSEKDGAWSYPKPWTGRVFGFKLHLATATDGEPIDADVVPANPNDMTLGKQAIRRLGRLFAPLNLKIEFVIADSGYCSNPLRDLIAEILGATALFHFNPRRKAQKQSQYSYLDDKEEWIKAKRQLRSRIERTFAQLKLHFGLNNLRIRGLTQVAQYILSRCMAYIACVIVAHRVGRPDLKASPKRLLWSS